MVRGQDRGKEHFGELPFAIQSFAEMRQGGYKYVDKTDLIWGIAHGAKVQFFARPSGRSSSVPPPSLPLLVPQFGSRGARHLPGGMWACAVDRSEKTDCRYRLGKCSPLGAMGSKWPVGIAACRMPRMAIGIYTELGLLLKAPAPLGSIVPTGGGGGKLGLKPKPSIWGYICSLPEL